MEMFVKLKHIKTLFICRYLIELSNLLAKWFSLPLQIEQIEFSKYFLWVHFCVHISSKNIVSALSVLISLTCHSYCSLVFVIAVMLEIADVFVSSFNR